MSHLRFFRALTNVTDAALHTLHATP